MSRPKPVVLVILDGFGCHQGTDYNAIAAAHKPQWDRWQQDYPHLLLDASGTAVGLPVGQMGNSEVGHLHMGAGRVVPQELTRINDTIERSEFADNPVLLDLIASLKKSKKALHVMGLLSEGGVHSHQNHLFAILKACHQHQLQEVVVHVFLDGRDSPPKSALASLNALDEALKPYPQARVASLSGRYFAMDRNQHWDRTELVYELLTGAKSPNHFNSTQEALTHFYAENISDEFIPPTLIGVKQPIETGDAVFFYNFRADRARQLTQMFVDLDFAPLVRKKAPALCQFVSMTHYADYLATSEMFAPMFLPNLLGEVIAKSGLKQLRIAETEKYAHVTFFFNGGCEVAAQNEDHILVPSPSVPTYDRCPEMSAPAITRELVELIHNQTYDVIICNYANADMVGHSGNFPATVKAIECLDKCLQDLGEAVIAAGGCLLITADHGNAEIMFDPKTNQPHTAHTNEQVPCLFVGKGWKAARPIGSLIDIAPTVLALLNIKQPLEMTGHSLLVEDYAKN